MFIQAAVKKLMLFHFLCAKWLQTMLWLTFY